MITYKGSIRSTARLEVSGTLCKQDYLAALPVLEGLHQKHRPVNYVIELVDFHGWTSPAVWQELKFDATHARDFGRVAIVGETKWQGFATKIGGFIFPAEVRFFHCDELAAAQQWAGAADSFPRI